MLNIVLKCPPVCFRLTIVCYWYYVFDGHVCGTRRTRSKWITCRHFVYFGRITSVHLPRKTRLHSQCPHRRWGQAGLEGLLVDHPPASSLVPPHPRAQGQPSVSHVPLRIPFLPPSPYYVCCSSVTHRAARVSPDVTEWPTIPCWWCGSVPSGRH